MTSPAILRYTAFTDTPEGGNPAGVVLDASALADAEMQQIAADLGYRESAFVTPRADGELRRPLLQPAREVPFCGHATIATAVALAERDGTGPLTFHTPAGRSPSRPRAPTARSRATLTSVAPHVEDVPGDLLADALAAARLERRRPRPRDPAEVSYAGARHLILGAATRERLATSTTTSRR